LPAEAGDALVPASIPESTIHDAVEKPGDVKSSAYSPA
jgi:hypothetical protein